MNGYGMQAREHWHRYAPSRFAALEDPEEFFTSLGQEVAAQASDLAAILGRTGSSEQTYWQQVARSMSARRLAEEVVMANLVVVCGSSLAVRSRRWGRRGRGRRRCPGTVRGACR